MDLSLTLRLSSVKNVSEILANPEIRVKNVNFDQLEFFTNRNLCEKSHFLPKMKFVIGN